MNLVEIIDIDVKPWECLECLECSSEVCQLSRSLETDMHIQILMLANARQCSPYLATVFPFFPDGGQHVSPKPTVK